MIESDSGDPNSQNPELTDEHPYSLNRGCEGCLAGWVVTFALMMFVSFVLAKGFRWIGPDEESIFFYFNWLIGLAVGGYVAARRGKTTGWSNALLVGIFAQLLIVGQLFEDKGIVDGLREMLADTSESWPKLMAIILTIPAALSGGLIWSRTRQ